MKGAEDEGVRNNPPVQSKFDKSKGKGLPPPHLSYPGAVMPTTAPGPRVFQSPKNVGSSGGIRSEHIDPSQLGSGMAEGRHYARAPNMAQTQMQGKSSSVGMGSMIPANQGQPSGRDPIKSATQRDTVAANPRMGTQVKARQGSGASDNRVTRPSAKQGPGVLAGSKRT